MQAASLKVWATPGTPVTTPLTQQTCLPCRERITIDNNSWKVERQLGLPSNAAKWRDDGILAALTTRRKSGAFRAQGDSRAVGSTAPLHHTASLAAWPALSEQRWPPALPGHCRTYC